MKLSKYLELKGETGPEFARRIGVTPQAVRYWRRGERRPSATLMLRIARATEGAVTPNDLLETEGEDG